MRPSTRACTPAPLRRTHLSPRGPGRAIGLAVATGLAAATLAQAQTAAPRYTARDLPKPTAALYCGGSPSLTDTGDVGQTCAYSGGSYTTTTSICVGYLFCYPTLTTIKVTYNLPAVWPANGGSVKPLTTSELSSIWNATLTRSGAVLANGVPITKKGVAIGYGQGWRWQPPYGTAGQTIAKPAALVGDYALYGFTQGGAMWWRELGGLNDAVVTADGQVKPVPLVPTAPLAGETLAEDQLMTIQDGDLAVRRRSLQTLNANGLATYRSEVWFLRGQQWTQIPLPGPQASIEYATIASNGRVLLRIDNADHTWRPEQPNVLTPTQGTGASVINASGVLGGAVPIPNDSKGRSKASIWWQGQQLDLQGLITSGLPSKTWALRNVVAINDRGQLVVSVEDTSKTGNASIKTVLLTPQ